MRIELEKYRQIYISVEELCVVAAFLKIPCLYGVSDRWMKSGHENLHTRVMRIASGMEKKGSLQIDISGTVQMETWLYKFVSCMGNADILGRINYESEDGLGKVYLYKKGTELVFLEPDGKGGVILENWIQRKCSKMLCRGSPRGKLRQRWHLVSWFRPGWVRWFLNAVMPFMRRFTTWRGQKTQKKIWKSVGKR